MVAALLEKWQSGRMRQSWKLLTVTGPGVRIPLSPPVEIQIELKPFKSYDLKGFFVYNTFKLFINAWTERDKIGYPKLSEIRVTDFYLNLAFTRHYNQFNDQFKNCTSCVLVLLELNLITTKRLPRWKQKYLFSFTQREPKPV